MLQDTLSQECLWEQSKNNTKVVDLVPKDHQKMCLGDLEGREADSTGNGVSDRGEVVEFSYIHILAQIWTSDHPGVPSGRTRVWHQGDRRKQVRFPLFWVWGFRQHRQYTWMVRHMKEKDQEIRRFLSNQKAA